ncbi:hypothetical protein [Desulfonema magnum]|uniref:Uncharacterized protein n=1 Tax=Desulfonema magnum TaxID=45655 RepID=A0A975BP75_9BACT|nr:hypothetical protein [Desulfonema magnum]QTA89075.1 Uncharacterized protein dnm_051230 [Desulfonema magnum]
MSDFIIQTGDQVIFLPNFGAAVVTVMPGVITGTGARCLVTKKLVCVVGDEKMVMVPGCPYVAGPYSISGVGMLKIMALAPNQQAIRTKSAGKPVILKGQMFDAVFQVMTPAQMPPPVSTTDPVPMHMGKGMFSNGNKRVKGT